VAPGADSRRARDTAIGSAIASLVAEPKYQFERTDDRRIWALFSVVIPTYNRRVKLQRAIDSVRVQTLSDLELIVVDDGSNDGTRAAVAGQDLAYIRQANSGAAAARNAGIKASRGRYIAFLDSDDWWYPTKLEKIALATAQTPAAGLIHSKAAVVDAEGSTRWILHSRAPSDAYRALARSDFVCTSAAVVKRELLDVVGPFETLEFGCEDWELWIRLARRFPVVLVPEVLVATEYHVAGSRTANLQHWLASINASRDRILAADTDLAARDGDRIRASVAYITGTIRLSSGLEVEALQDFAQAIRLNRAHWKALVYWAILRTPILRLRLPGRARRLLKLPEEFPPS
jgi:glycosyltransferase involved in cell wall biosynthesis